MRTQPQRTADAQRILTATTVSICLQTAIFSRSLRVFALSVDDVRAFLGPEVAALLTNNTMRYVRILYDVIDHELHLLAEELKQNPPAHRRRAVAPSDPYERYQEHREEKWNEVRDERRRRQQQQAQPQADESSGESASASAAVTLAVPVELTRRYEISLRTSPTEKPTPLRLIRADSVGHLVTVRGVVTRVTDVAPLVRVVAYICFECGWETYQPINDRVFTPISKCPSAVCTLNRSDGALQQQARGSKFVRFQSVRLQETASEVPVGAIPRHLSLRLYGANTRQCKPGDDITVTGVFLPTPHTGYRAIRAGLTADVYVEVFHLVAAKRAYKAMLQEQQDSEQQAELDALLAAPNVYGRLSESLAPEIYGHSDIKKALLLLLTSGVTTQLSDGLKIRGDINLLLMGDPGVAKSQLLKHIAHIAPRAVYTTGKGSSGVGLTAAVMRDPVSGDMTLEGGSLVLADMGVCCIDEFDKMEEADRSAIHEVMEQQTVSIAKAGITTTLNARTSVLAAANPVYGRWKSSLPVEANLGLPTSLLSRFDLSFIILDRPNTAHDSNLAAHVTHVHMYRVQPEMSFTPLSAAVIRAYIARARSFDPSVPSQLTDDIVAYYVGLRSDVLTSGRSSRTDPRANERQRFATPRSLLSVLRLAQAHARLHLRSAVNKDDVDEAIRLMIVSQHSADDDADDAYGGRRRDPIGDIYEMIRRQRDAVNSNTVLISSVYPMALAKGYTLAEWKQCLSEYEDLNVWIVKHNAVTFIQQSADFTNA